jgi:uncharacterized protein (TIGR02118 family)
MDIGMNKFVVIFAECDEQRRWTGFAPAGRVPGLARITRNEVVGVVQRAHVQSAKERPSGVDELWFAGTSPEDTLETLRTAYTGVPVVQICLVHENRVFERPAPGGALVKRFSFLCRKGGMSRTDFSTYWRDVHAPMVACHRHVTRYVQNHVIAGTCPDPLFDGIGEFRIADLAGMQADYDSEAGQSMKADVHNFVASVSTYVDQAHDAPCR